MENYYDMLGLSADAPIDELKKKLNQQMRVWSHRTNAPQIERRQEAERMVRVLEKMEDTLLDEKLRSEYDQSLKGFLEQREQEQKEEKKEEITPFPAFQPYDWETVEFDPTEEDTSVEKVSASTEQETSTTIAKEDKILLIAKGEDYLQQDRFSDALEIADRLVAEIATNADVWAFMGKVRMEMLDYHEAMTALIKACDIDPQNASHVAQLGQIFLKQGKLDRARQQFKRASALAPDQADYQFYLGMLLIKQKQEVEGLKMLEQCLRMDSGNREYQRELVRAYLEIARSSWTQVLEGSLYLLPGRYPTRRLDLGRAQAFLDRAKRIPIHDIELRNDIHRLNMEIESHKKRKFAGSWWMAIISLLFLLATDMINTSTINHALLILPVLYLVSGLTPAYRIYRHEVREKSGRTDFAYLFIQMRDRYGTNGAYFFSVVLWIPYFFITSFVLSLIIFRNFYKNYLSTD